MNYVSYPKIHPPQEQSQVYRLCSQSKDYKPQSTVYKDCTVYGHFQDYTQN